MSDIIYDGIFLFETTPVDPASLIDNVNPRDGLAEAPPPISGYRQANVAGMACWNCGHFSALDDADGDGIVDGICNLFEALADGECTCDRFTAHSDLFRQSPHTSWTEDMADMVRNGMGSMGPSVDTVNYSDGAVLREITLASPAEEEDGLVWKDILKTGQWSHTPTNKGVMKKKLQIVRDGKTDPENGILALSELYDNFNEGAVRYVTVPLSDDDVDHKNIARLNTGFVRKLKLEDRGGESYLRAGIDFTEPDVKAKVMRGTIPDVSAGVPFGVTRRKDNRFFTAVLDHVCLTRKPFVDLEPFGIAAADGQENIPVEAYEQESVAPQDGPSSVVETPAQVSESEPESAVVLSFRQHEKVIRDALTNQLRLSPDYFVTDVRGNVAIVEHRISKVKWEVEFRKTGDENNPIILAAVDSWKLIEESQQQSKEPEVETVAASDIQKAQELRELRLAQPTSQTGGGNMSVLSLDGVELSDEARARIQSVLNENAELKRRDRANEIDQRIEELQALGFADRPGALKLYRQVMLSDDGGAACVLFSDSDDDDKKERLTAIEILDRFIDALKAGDNVQFSDQHLASANDKKPPRDASGEGKSVEERVKDSNTALYGNPEGQQRKRRGRRN